MAFPDGPSEADIARDMISPSAQKRMAIMPPTYRPFEEAPFSQYDYQTSISGTPDERRVMEAVGYSPYSDRLMELAIAEDMFDGSYEGLADIFKGHINAHYSGAATMPNFYTDQEDYQGSTHTDYANDILVTMNTLYPDRARDTKNMERMLMDFEAMGKRVAEEKDPLMKRGVPLRPEMYMPLDEANQRQTDLNIKNKVMAEQLNRLQEMKTAEFDSLNRAESVEQKDAVIQNISLINSKMKEIESFREKAKAEFSE